MRIWTIHPSLLDRQGLTALWRETLLAQAVFMGETRGYRHHPQLDRFRGTTDPAGAIAWYLLQVREEAAGRGYSFDRGRIRSEPVPTTIEATDGQLEREWHHLLAKLAARSPQRFAEVREIAVPDHHPMFRIVPGPVAAWERA